MHNDHFFYNIQRAYITIQGWVKQRFSHPDVSRTVTHDPKSRTWTIKYATKNPIKWMTSRTTKITITLESLHILITFNGIPNAMFPYNYTDDVLKPGYHAALKATIARLNYLQLLTAPGTWVAIDLLVDALV